MNSPRSSRRKKLFTEVPLHFRMIYANCQVLAPRFGAAFA